MLCEGIKSQSWTPGTLIESSTSTSCDMDGWFKVPVHWLPDAWRGPRCGSTCPVRGGRCPTGRRSPEALQKFHYSSHSVLQTGRWEVCQAFKLAWKNILVIIPEKRKKEVASNGGVTVGCGLRRRLCDTLKHKRKHWGAGLKYPTRRKNHPLLKLPSWDVLSCSESASLLLVASEQAGHRRVASAQRQRQRR